MTMIAGFVARDGILLCSESQYTASHKESGEKIITRSIGKDVRLTFAFCGDNDYAKSTIEDCFQRALRMSSKSRTIEGIRDVLRAQIHKSTAHCEVDRPQFIIAIGAKGEPARLYIARDAAIAPIDPCEFRGSGADIGRSIYRSFFRQRFAPTIEDLLPVCLYALSMARRNDAGCGFGPQFFAVRNAFVSGIYGSDEMDFAERPIQKFEKLAAAMLFNAATASEEEFASFSEQVPKTLKSIRADLLSPDGAYRQLLQAMRHKIS